MPGKYLIHSAASPEIGADLIRAGAGQLEIVASGTLVGTAVEWENQVGYSAVSDKRYSVEAT